MEKTKKLFEFVYQGPNYLLKREGFYVSYNDNPGMCMLSFRSDGDSDETALCFNGLHYILNGDLRKNIEECKNDKDIFDVFLKSRIEISSWSTLTKKDVKEYMKSLYNK